MIGCAAHPFATVIRNASRYGDAGTVLFHLSGKSIYAKVLGGECQYGGDGLSRR